MFGYKKSEAKSLGKIWKNLLTKKRSYGMMVLYSVLICPSLHISLVWTW